MEDENSSSFLVRRAVATQLSLTINPRNLFYVYAVIYQPRLSTVCCLLSLRDLLILNFAYFTWTRTKLRVRKNTFFQKRSCKNWIGYEAKWQVYGKRGLDRKAKARWKYGSNRYSSFEEFFQLSYNKKKNNFFASKYFLKLLDLTPDQNDSNIFFFFTIIENTKMFLVKLISWFK